MYLSPTIIRVMKSRRMEMAGRVARIRESRVHTGVLVVKRMGTSQLGRPSLRLGGNITRDVERMGLGH
jgi:hypothetical protein